MSTKWTRTPARLSKTAIAAAVVVFAVPPLWFEIAITFIIFDLPFRWHSVTSLFLAETPFRPSGFKAFADTLAISTNVGHGPRC
jgi:hypothetical protein